MSPMEKLFANLPKLPSMPKVVQELIASLVKEDIDIGTLVDKVKQDQALSARVLQMANSSAYGSSQKVGSIDKAVTMIGLSALRSVVIAYPRGFEQTATKSSAPANASSVLPSRSAKSRSLIAGVKRS